MDVVDKCSEQILSFPFHYMPHFTPANKKCLAVGSLG